MQDAVATEAHATAGRVLQSSRASEKACLRTFQTVPLIFVTNKHMFCVSFCLLSASRSLLPLIKSIGFTWRLPDRKRSCNSNRESGSNVSPWTHRKKHCSLMFFQFLPHAQTRGPISGLLCTIPRAAGSMATALGFPG